MAKVGSTFESFLKDANIADEVYAEAEKKVFAWQLEEAMKSAKVSKSELAKRMETSRAAVDRMLDPTVPSLTLITMTKAARALNRRIVISLEDRAPTRKKRGAKAKRAAKKPDVKVRKKKAT